MSTTREGPNPLRPYYVPPSIGLPPEVGNATTSGATHGVGLKNGSAASYASSARDIFIDIDYSEYLSESSPGTLAQIKRLLDQALYKYTSVLLAQPFEVGKTVLQVRSQMPADGTIPVAVVEDMHRQPSKYRDSAYDEYPSDDSDHEDAYFTSAARASHSYTAPRPRRQYGSDISGYTSPLPSDAGSITPTAQFKLNLKRADSVMEVISQEWSKEGAWGVWKASNSTFFYSILLKTIEGWSRGLLSAVFNVPDPGAISGLGASVEVIDTQYPWASLAVAVGAAAMAGVILAPLDIIRTKLILTPISSPRRSIMQNLRALPSYICPSTLMIPTILHSLVSPLFTHSTPLFLRSRFAIDPVLTPTTYSVATFMSSTVELFIRLPLETVLRRGQMSVLASPEYRIQNKSPETIVDIGPYRGVIGTMWSIVREEGGSSGQESVVGTGGARASRKTKKAEKRGQGFEGLWRGWRVGMWGLVGMWSAAALGGSGNGGEF
ncbi:hypothetical protein BP6252_00351 [Coleophoma cylindrospora]|uniref:Mitochondrial fusion and transport protein ugo1 n=1 Tax=Coleophoma cylindrospora TaxID=1849047 RepID=A0A3D8SPS2_9HELO|nr:hypothetical protein BP6252_00351 [Coleophoma cylindrospora]